MGVIEAFSGTQLCSRLGTVERRRHARGDILSFLRFGGWLSIFRFDIHVLNDLGCNTYASANTEMVRQLPIGFSGFFRHSDSCQERFWTHFAIGSWMSLRQNFRKRGHCRYWGRKAMPFMVPLLLLDVHKSIYISPLKVLQADQVPSAISTIPKFIGCHFRRHGYFCRCV